MTDSNIDSLIDQIDDKINALTTNDNCCECNCFNNNLIHIIECNHYICLKCAHNLVAQLKTTNCVCCDSKLQIDLCVLLSNSLKNPINKLSLYHGINAKDYVWAYSGANGNWLYSKDHQDIINGVGLTAKNKKYWDTQIELNINNTVYIIDTNEWCQYQKNDPTRKRDIIGFHLNTANDFKKRKIIGIAGKLI